MVAEAEGAAGAAAVAGREEGVVDAGRHDLDASRRRAVEPGQLVGLLGAAHADGVGAPDHLHLGPIPQRRLAVAAFGLDPRQRVEGRHQRQVELVLEPVAGHARQPVVGVDDIDAAAAVDVVHDAVGELVDDAGQLLLGQVGRAGVDVHDPEARLDRDLVGQVVAPPAHVRRAVDARLRQRRHQLAHVDVHAAAVAGARLGERRRVERKHRQPPHREGQRSSASGDSAPFTNRAAPAWSTSSASTDAAPVR